MIDFTVRNPDYSEGLGNEDFDEGIYQRIFSYEGSVFVLTYFSEQGGEFAE